jgi:hypothetical protein
MPSLDQPSTARPAPAWTGETVRQRLVEAFAIERRMPRERFASIASTWPATPLHDFRDMLHWSDHRERVWDDWARAKGVFAWEITRMDEAIEWLRWLDVAERRCLAAWATGKARGLNVRAIIRSRGWKPRSFYRAVDNAAERIAERLNKQGVQVR